MRLIKLTSGQFAKVDDEDFEYINKLKWHANFSKTTKTYYAKSSRQGVMSRKIMNAPEGMFVDHINHDTLDNCKSNLRLCTRGQNNSNLSKIRKNSTSGLRGVNWLKQDKRWIARIQVNGKRLFLGSFNNKNSAYLAYCEANKKYFGEFGGLL